MYEAPVNKQPKIICSVATAPLQGLRAFDFQQFGQALEDGGYEGISALPYRTEDIVRLYQEYFPPVILVEDAWNPTTNNNIILSLLEGIHGELKRKIGDTDEAPILQDALFFPNKKTSAKITDGIMATNPAAHFGSIDFDSRFAPDRTMIHIQSLYKSHALTSEEILQRSEDTGSLLLFDPVRLLDPKNVSYPDQPTKKFSGEWERQLATFADRIAGVDIHPTNKQEVNDLLNQTGKLYELTLASQKLCTNLQFLRVETLVPLMSQLPSSPYQKKGTDFLRQVAEVLKSLRNK